MKGKQKTKGRISRGGKKTPRFAESEIDVLKVLVKSTLAKDTPDKEEPSEFSFGSVSVNFVRHELSKNGIRLNANAREFELLRYFLAHEGEVIPRDRLLREVWGFKETPETRSVDNYILSLRKKIEDDAAHPAHILTFRGAGYKFIR
jgi:two-component system alkaline phosphatase synthesis response regulator PhoP